MELADGATVAYDYLVIATGPDLAFDEIEGWARRATPNRSATSITPSRPAQAFDEFCKNPGPIVVGAVQGASCFGPAYEFAMILDTELRSARCATACR